MVGVWPTPSLGDHLFQGLRPPFSNEQLSKNVKKLHMNIINFVKVFLVNFCPCAWPVYTRDSGFYILVIFIYILDLWKRWMSPKFLSQCPVLHIDSYLRHQ